MSVRNCHQISLWTYVSLNELIIFFSSKPIKGYLRYETWRYCWGNHYLCSPSLLFIIKAWKKQSIIFLLSLYHAARLRTPTLLLICVQFISQWEATQIWWLWRRHEHQTKFREFIYEEMLAFDFENFMCIISLCIFILKFHDQMYIWTI